MRFDGDGENVIDGSAADAAYEGITTHLTMKAKDGSSVVATIAGASAKTFPVSGSSVRFAFTSRDAIVLPA